MSNQQILIPKPELTPTSKLTVDGKNPNKMTPQQIERLKTSIKKYGFIVPIITNKNLIIADGEQRWRAAKQLEMPNIPVIQLPVTQVDHRLLRQVMNKLKGEHDPFLDAQEFDAIIEQGKKDDLKYLLDLTDAKLESYLNELHPPKQETYQIPQIENIQTNITQDTIIQLGTHRLMCGDATSVKDTKKLLNNANPCMVFTDPPYGVNYDKHKMNKKCLKQTPQQTSKSGFKNWGKIKGDTSTHTFLKFLEVISTQTNLTQASWYLCTSSKHLDQVLGKLNQLNIYYATPIVWVKEHFVLSWERYKAQHENIIFAGNGAYPTGSKSIWYGKNNETTVWQINRDNINKNAKHPTQKPIELVTRALFNSSQPQDVVYDGFGGSGTTLLACEQTKRVCYMMELDPRYCEVICQRWETYTGQKRKYLK